MTPSSAVLNAGQEAYVARCAAFATEVIAPNFRRYDEDNAFPALIHEAARVKGILNVALPRDLGGQGLGFLTMARGGRLMARVCAPATFTLGFNHGSLRPVLWAGSDGQKDRFVRRLLARGGYASWCMTEQDVSGSNLMAVRTRAERTSAGWVITGDKCMTGNGAVASVFLVLADAWDGDRRLGPTIFAVEKDESPSGSVVVSANTDKLGFRCLTTVEVSFRAVEVDDGCVIGAVGEGLPVLVDSLDFMRFGGGVVILGLVEGALLDLMPWLEDREIYGGLRLVDDSHMQVVLGRLVAEAIALEGLLERVAIALDEGRPVSREANALKLLGADLALRATAEVMQAWGWRGIDGRFDAQKRFRDARQTSIYEGTNEVLAMNQFRQFLRSWRASRP
jgi:alkylation response protein AidB-like acyl-CoA dehydrogenase